jgi:hypothetical protein
MEWIRNVRVENGKSSFGEAIKPALSIVDAALPSATGPRRADLLAHTGWATFLLWRDGDRRLNPADAYREAMSIDPRNPFANAMLAHWTLFQDQDAVPAAAQLFDVAVHANRALDAVRTLQWAAYTNADSNPEAIVARVQLANAMRLGGEQLDVRRAQALWAPYYFATLPGRENDRQLLLDALAPDAHISTLNWAFTEYAAKDESRLRTNPLLRRPPAREGRTDGAGNRRTARARPGDGEQSRLRFAARCGPEPHSSHRNRKGGDSRHRVHFDEQAGDTGTRRRQRQPSASRSGTTRQTSSTSPRTGHVAQGATRQLRLQPALAALDRRMPVRRPSARPDRAPVDAGAEARDQDDAEHRRSPSGRRSVPLALLMPDAMPAC